MLCTCTTRHILQSHNGLEHIFVPCWRGGNWGFHCLKTLQLQNFSGRCPEPRWGAHSAPHTPSWCSLVPPGHLNPGSATVSCWVPVHRLISLRLQMCEELVEVVVGGCGGWHGHPESVFRRVADYRLTATAVWLSCGSVCWIEQEGLRVNNSNCLLSPFRFLQHNMTLMCRPTRFPFPKALHLLKHAMMELERWVSCPGYKYDCYQNTSPLHPFNKKSLLTLTRRCWPMIFSDMNLIASNSVLLSFTRWVQLLYQYGLILIWFLLSLQKGWSLIQEREKERDRERDRERERERKREGDR